MCDRVSPRCPTQTVDASDHNHVDEITVDIQELGFTNPSLVTEDDDGYASLQRELDGYEKLRHSVMEVKNQANEHLEVLDDQGSSPTPCSSTRPIVYMESDGVEGEYVHPQNQSHDYLELVDDTVSLPSCSEKFINQAESMETEDEFAASRTQSCLYEEIPADIDHDSGNTVPEEQYDGCVDVVNYTESNPTIPKSLTKKAVSMETQDCSGNLHQQASASTNPKNKHEGYVDMVDYIDSLPSHSDFDRSVCMVKEEGSTNSKPQSPQYTGIVNKRNDQTRNKAGNESVTPSTRNGVFRETKQISENKSLQGQNEGYVDYVDYTVSETEAKYTRPQSQTEGYVGMADYTDSLHLHSNNYSSIQIEGESPGAQSDGYEELADCLMTSYESRHTKLLKEPHEYLEILPEPETLQTHSRKTRPQSQYVGHLEVVEYSDSVVPKCENNYSKSQNEGYVGVMEYTDSLQTQTHGDFIDIVVSSPVEDEFGYTRLQKELPGYEKLHHEPDVDESENTSLQSLSQGYVDVSEYSDPHPSKNDTCQTESIRTEIQLGNNHLQSRYEGYVDYVDYTDSFKTPAQSLKNIKVSKATREDAPQGLHAGYVDVVDYIETSEPRGSNNKDEFLESTTENKNSFLQSVASGYVPITEYHDTIPPSSQRIAKQTVSMETKEKSKKSKLQRRSRRKYLNSLSTLPEKIAKQEDSMETSL